MISSLEPGGKYGYIITVISYGPNFGWLGSSCFGYSYDMVIDSSPMGPIGPIWITKLGASFVQGKDRVSHINRFHLLMLHLRNFFCFHAAACRSTLWIDLVEIRWPTLWSPSACGLDIGPFICLFLLKGFRTILRHEWGDAFKVLLTSPFSSFPREQLVLLQGVVQVSHRRMDD